MGFKRGTINILAGAVSLFAIYSSPAFATDDTEPTLTTAELKELLSGNSLAGNGKVNDPKEPYDWIAHYGADGTIRLKLKPEWGGTLTRGRWWLTDDGKQCRQFETGHGKEGCWRFVREDKFVRFLPASGVAVEGRAVMLKGDHVVE